MADRVELPQAERCDGCRFWRDNTPGENPVAWEDKNDEPAGYCRRYPAYQDRYTHDWCGEFSPRQPAVEPLPHFSLLVAELSRRAANALASAGVNGWLSLFAEDPISVHNFGQTSFKELLSAMVKLGVPAPHHWSYPGVTRQWFVNSGGRFMDQEPTPVPTGG